MTKQIGLGPADFLLLAEGHLRKARQRLEQESWCAAAYNAHGQIIYATNSARHARKLLEQKEQPCKKP